MTKHYTRRENARAKSYCVNLAAVRQRGLYLAGAVCGSYDSSRLARGRLYVLSATLSSQDWAQH